MISTRPAEFDIRAFGRALDERDLGLQLACYAPDADVRVFDADLGVSRPRLIHGTHEILAWLIEAQGLGLEVTHLVDGCDRVAFSQRWCRPDGVHVVAASTAELCDDLITTQHTNVSRDPHLRRNRPSPPEQTPLSPWD